MPTFTTTSRLLAASIVTPFASNPWRKSVATYEQPWTIPADDVSAYFNTDASQNVLSRHSARQATSLHRMCAAISPAADRFERADRACQTDERSLTIPRRFFASSLRQPRDELLLLVNIRGSKQARKEAAKHPAETTPVNQPSRRLKSIGKYLSLAGSATRVSFPARVIFIFRRSRNMSECSNCGNDSCLLVSFFFSFFCSLFSFFFFKQTPVAEERTGSKEKATVTDRHFSRAEGRQTRDVPHIRWKSFVYVTTEDQSRRGEVIEKETWIWVSLRRLGDSQSRTIFYVRSNFVLCARLSLPRTLQSNDGWV